MVVGVLGFDLAFILLCGLGCAAVHRGLLALIRGTIAITGRIRVEGGWARLLGLICLGLGSGFLLLVLALFRDAR